MKLSATETAQKLINDFPHLFKDNAETLFVLGTALIYFWQKKGEMLIEKEIKNGTEISKIDEIL